MDVAEALDILRLLVHEGPHGGEAAGAGMAVPHPATDSKDASALEILEKAKGELTGQVTELSAKLAAAECQAATAEMQCASLVSEHASLHTKIDALEKELKTIVADRDTLRSSNRTYVRRVTDQASRLEALERDVRLLHEDHATVYECQQDQLLALSKELQQAVVTLTDENTCLREALEQQAVRMKQLHAAEEEKLRWETEAKMLREEREAWGSEWENATAHAERGKQLAMQLQAFLAAAQGNRESTQEAVEASEIMLRQWETAFITTSLPEVPNNTRSEAARNEGVEDDLGPGARVGSEVAETESRRDTLVPLLEAKTVDLALSLHAAEVTCELRSQQLQALASQHMTPVLDALPLAEALLTLGPVVHTLSEKNTELESKLVAAEQFSSTVFDMYQQVLEEYTEEVHHNLRLEAALAGRGRTPPGGAVEKMSDDCHSHSTATGGLLGPVHDRGGAPKKNRFTLRYNGFQGKQL